MKKPILYKCELCGIEVFKTYISGDIKIGEQKISKNGKIEEIYHHCYFDNSINSSSLNEVSK